MKTLSLCMIVRDEEENLDNCLSSIKDCADEIIIVDTGSVDKTKQIASRYTDKVYDFEWVYDFSKARNFSFDKAKSEYIIWLDGDDIVLPNTVKKINEWKEKGEECDCIMCSYVASFDSNYKPIFHYLRERIVKNKPSLRFVDPIHEVIIPSGKILTREDIEVFHSHKNKPYTDRNLTIYKRMLSEGRTLTPRQQFYYARELYYNNKISEALHQFSVFLSGGKGWVENNIEACLNLSRCYQLQGELDNGLTSLFGSFIYDIPRGEILYEIGKIFEKKNMLNQAIFWFKQALKAKPNVEGGGFVNLDCYTFLPAIELCVCYYKLGKKHLARHYHQLSKKYKPEYPSVMYNEKFFNNEKSNKK